LFASGQTFKILPALVSARKRIGIITSEL
jgi:hypothetical protein